MLTLMLDGHRETCETCTQILEEANVGVFHGDEEKLKMDLSGMSGKSQNLLENWDDTRHLLDVSWRYGLKKFFFRNKTFLFFKIESWNFQVQFEIEFRETLQNFNSIRQPIKKDENKKSLNKLNELKFCEVSGI